MPDPPHPSPASPARPAADARPAAGSTGPDIPALPQGFVFGTGVAAYQVEGAVAADGRGESIWDRFAATPGRVRGGETGAIACDFYHRSADDVALLGRLGVDAFRFSVAWPRVVPEGRGAANPRGLDFYDRLVDQLLAAGIQPYPVLYHWDLPQPLQDRGGWAVRETVEAFAAFADHVVARIGDRVAAWVSCNEPRVAAFTGYEQGVHAPGHTDLVEAVAAGHHLLLAHARALQVIRGRFPAARVGISLDLSPVYPASDAPADVAAAELQDALANRWFLDPLFRGVYPEAALAHRRPAAPPVRAGDLDAIRQPIDFLGVNMYSRHVVRGAGDGLAPMHVPQAGPRTAMGWEVYPDALEHLLRRLHADYRPARLVITENGAAYGDVRSHDGSIHDPERCTYLAAHLTAVAGAIGAGVPVEGYFVWALLDNFEWAHGYSKRFGLVYVEYPTQERVPKDSFHWYRAAIAQSRSASRGAG